MDKKIWVLENFGTERNIFGYFTTKLEAVKAIELWGNNVNGGYRVKNKGGIIGLKVDAKANENANLIYLEVDGEDGYTVALWLKAEILNSGTDLINV